MNPGALLGLAVLAGAGALFWKERQDEAEAKKAAEQPPKWFPQPKPVVDPIAEYIAIATKEAETNAVLRGAREALPPSFRDAFDLGAAQALIGEPDSELDALIAELSAEERSAATYGYGLASGQQS